VLAAEAHPCTQLLTLCGKTMRLQRSGMLLAVACTSSSIAGNHVRQTMSAIDIPWLPCKGQPHLACVTTSVRLTWS
jgi:hypothetical protein